MYIASTWQADLVHSTCVDEAVAVQQIQSFENTPGNKLHLSSSESLAV
jgi:hypothetical protein